LKGLKLIEQECAERDRRVVWTWITSAGLELLGHMKAGELKELIRLLEAVRKPSQE
jgi:DNA-binding MarR family transcriptional regulator